MPPSPAGLRCRVARAAFSAALADVKPSFCHGRFDVDPALGERPQDRLRDVSQLAQAVAPDVPGEAEGGSSARSADWYMVPAAFCHG